MNIYCQARAYFIISSILFSFTIILQLLDRLIIHLYIKILYKGGETKFETI